MPKKNPEYQLFFGEEEDQSDSSREVEDIKDLSEEECEESESSQGFSFTASIEIQTQNEKGSLKDSNNRENKGASNPNEDEHLPPNTFTLTKPSPFHQLLKQGEKDIGNNVFISKRKTQSEPNNGIKKNKENQFKPASRIIGFKTEKEEKEAIKIRQETNSQNRIVQPSTIFYKPFNAPRVKEDSQSHNEYTSSRCEIDPSTGFVLEL